mmetsp:Transcript_4004/g.15997  ORF Transcript_4004/g.15997 Transcript_4004/m.15997 type:complete len:439 (-) Transcript_4004:688-2004(-)
MESSARRTTAGPADTSCNDEAAAAATVTRNGSSSSSPVPPLGGGGGDAGQPLVAKPRAAAHVQQRSGHHHHHHHHHHSSRGGSSLEYAWTMGVVLTTAFAFAFFIAADVAQGGLGTSNGRAVSFLNSLNSVASFRRQRRVLRSVSSDTTQQASPNTERKRSEVLYLRSSRHSAAHRVKLFSLVFLAKFGSQSLGSLMIGATPVVLKGPRHMASWLFSFACIQLCPRDSVYNKLQDHVALLLVVRIGCALYKLRKFTFVAEFALDRHLSFLWMLSALVVVIDGNNLCSRITTWGWLRGVGRTSTSDFLFGVVALLRRVIPIGLAASLVTCSTCAASPARHHHRWSVFFFFFRGTTTRASPRVFAERSAHARREPRSVAARRVGGRPSDRTTDGAAVPSDVVVERRSPGSSSRARTTPVVLLLAPGACSGGGEPPAWAVR